MYLQFLDLYGNPVYVRPELADALRGISVTWEGKPRAATMILLSNRETFRVRGHVDTIKDAIEQWHTERGGGPQVIGGQASADSILLTGVQSVSHSEGPSPYGERYGITD